MEEQKQYHDELLVWCNNIYSYWNSMKIRVSKHYDMERLEEWEESCRQLKEKLQTDFNVEFDDYLTAKSLYEQWEQLFKEMNAYQEEMEIDSNEHVEWEEQTQIQEEFLEPNVYQEEIEIDSDERLELEGQRQIQEEFLATGAYQEEAEIDSDERFELEGQRQIQEEFLATDAYQEENEVDSDERLELEGQTQFQEEFLATDAFQEEIEIETDKFIDLDEQEQLQYREYLLEWCNNIYSNWESMKPRFSKLFDLKSLEEWEVSYRHLKEKLQEGLKADFDDYQTAKSLFEHWEQLFKESYAYQEAIGV